jgi:hypothetical protein
MGGKFVENLLGAKGPELIEETLFIHLLAVVQEQNVPGGCSRFHPEYAREAMELLLHLVGPRFPPVGKVDPDSTRKGMDHAKVPRGKVFLGKGRRGRLKR